jgi:hypothetical protein
MVVCFIRVSVSNPDKGPSKLWLLQVGPACAFVRQREPP